MNLVNRFEIHLFLEGNRTKITHGLDAESEGRGENTRDQSNGVNDDDVNCSVKV